MFVPPAIVNVSVALFAIVFPTSDATVSNKFCTLPELTVVNVNPPAPSVVNTCSALPSTIPKSVSTEGIVGLLFKLL